MKIFSSFDTEFKNKLLEKEKEKYGKDKVILISHGKFYYYFYIIFPTILLFLWVIAYYYILFSITSELNDDMASAVKWFGYILMFMWFIPLAIKLIKKYIDYVMDFLIVTPITLVYYNQEWIFTRRWRTVDVEKIKTISFNKDGILRSMFNFWNIIILTEWDEKWTGEINYSFIDDPDTIRDKIYEIIKNENNNKTHNE